MSERTFDRHHEDPYEHYSEWGHKRTFAAGWAKIHEGCGGLCRFVEAWDSPGVGWTAECLSCGTEGIVEEHVVFVTDPAVPHEDGVQALVDEVPPSDRADLEYDVDLQQREGFRAAQDDLRDQLGEVFEGGF
ncbi:MULTISPECIES: hypothetical protein [Halorussus]|uniref:hypothetical protein n=1 Tax=Halorussus TaxID=1070314 RepID=UPI00209D3628|nr:hypothetical protein [Halorussus vallis]USZ78609.1 hypothetical protein NGM07_25000 [Halorussus vallis]